jgi:hypothetical protein
VADKHLRLHAKILKPPNNHSISTMVQRAQEVYRLVGVDVLLVSEELLSQEDIDIDAGWCNGGVTEEQKRLFENRNGVGPNEAVIYFIGSTTPLAYDGCAAHPEEQPGAVVAATAGEWTLAHELGHLLGLIHCDELGSRLRDRLMTGGGTSRITNPPPDLISSEVEQILGSSLLVEC